jgi:heat-inducible transcriptional repressor
MSVTPHAEITQRQRGILCRVVEEYVATGQPVGSKTLVERAGLVVSSSTVRAELAELEHLGLLTHPHTSAGRVPTDRGYRIYVDELLERTTGRRQEPFPLDLSGVRSEVESAMRATTEMLSQVTRLLAVVSAPPLETATVRHVEVLLLQPRVVMVVVITSTGGVTKRVFTFEDPVDTGLASWAGEYLNERVAGLTLGAHLLRQRFEDPSLSTRERGFLATIKPAFTVLLGDEQRLYFGGAAGLLDDVRSEELRTYQALLEVLEQRAVLLDVLAGALDPRRPFVRVGDELEEPKLRALSLVGATYGIASRPLGAVSLVGPLRMDYDKAIRSVSAAARELSRFVGGIYGEN